MGNTLSLSEECRSASGEYAERASREMYARKSPNAFTLIYNGLTTQVHGKQSKYGLEFDIDI